MIYGNMACIGNSPNLTNKLIIQNGNYNVSDDNADGYTILTINVPNSYSPSDEEKDVSNGSLVSQTSTTVTDNNVVIDTTFNNEVVVNVNIVDNPDTNMDLLNAYLSNKNNFSSTFINNNITMLKNYAFHNFNVLQNVQLDACENIGCYAFYDCYYLKSVVFNNCTYINNNAFADCKFLSQISFPKCSYIGSNAFYKCMSLAEISFPNCSCIERNAFNYCSKLTSIYFLGSNICTLLGPDVFSYTPITNSTYTGSFGSIYVTQSLYNTYISSSYWSNYQSRIVSYTGAIL